MSVSITGDLLTVKGERGFEHDVKDESAHRLERVYGKLERPVQLPKSEEVKPKEIKLEIL